MHSSNSITIQAPLERVFELTSDLEQWPRVLPHYRYIKYFSREGNKSHVKMAAKRGVIPIAWESIHIVDRDKKEQHFSHLKAWTKGMEVVWTYAQLPGDEGVKVEIVHDLKFRFPPLTPIAEPIIGGFFIEHVANQTLSTFKTILEEETRQA